MIPLRGFIWYLRKSICVSLCTQFSRQDMARRQVVNPLSLGEQKVLHRPDFRDLVLQDRSETLDRLRWLTKEMKDLVVHPGRVVKVRQVHMHCIIPSKHDGMHISVTGTILDGA